MDWQELWNPCLVTQSNPIACPLGPGHLEKVRAEGWGPKVEGPTFRSFSVSGGSSQRILVVFEASGPSNVHVWSSRSVV